MSLITYIHQDWCGYTQIEGWKYVMLILFPITFHFWTSLPFPFLSEVKDVPLKKLTTVKTVWTVDTLTQADSPHLKSLQLAAINTDGDEISTSLSSPINVSNHFITNYSTRTVQNKDSAEKWNNPLINHAGKMYVIFSFSMNTTKLAPPIRQGCPIPAFSFFLYCWITQPVYCSLYKDSKYHGRWKFISRASYFRPELGLE